MRIVFVITVANNAGGIRTVATYARLLSQRGHDVTVVSTPPPSPPLRDRARSLLRGRGWMRTPRPGPSHVDRASVVHLRLDRYRPITDRDLPDADVVIATWWRTAEWVARLSPRKGTKVHFVQGDDADVPGQPRASVEATWRLPLHRIVCSDWLADLARWHGDSNVFHVPNGVDLAHFSAPPRSRQRRPTVGLLYAESWLKGCDVAVKALELAAEHRRDIRLVAFGSSPVDATGPLPRFTEYTLRPDESVIPQLYAGCDAWLWPSRREGFGLPILEAMACRTPVVATTAGAAPSLVVDGAGILVPSDDPLAMARGMERLLGTTDAEWRLMSDRAREVAERHDWGVSVRLLEDALESARRAD